MNRSKKYLRASNADFDEFDDQKQKGNQMMIGQNTYLNKYHNNSNGYSVKGTPGYLEQYQNEFEMANLNQSKQNGLSENYPLNFPPNQNTQIPPQTAFQSPHPNLSVNYSMGNHQAYPLNRRERANHASPHPEDMLYPQNQPHQYGTKSSHQYQIFETSLAINEDQQDTYLPQNVDFPQRTLINTGPNQIYSGAQNPMGINPVFNNSANFVNFFTGKPKPKPMKTSKEYWQYWFKVNAESDQGRSQDPEHFEKLFSKRNHNNKPVKNMTLDDIIAIRSKSTVAAYTTDGQQTLILGDLMSPEEEIYPLNPGTKAACIKFTSKGDELVLVTNSISSKTSSIYIVPSPLESRELLMQKRKSVQNIPGTAISMNVHSLSSTSLLLFRDKILNVDLQFGKILHSFQLSVPEFKTVDFLADNKKLPRKVTDITSVCGEDYLLTAIKIGGFAYELLFDLSESRADSPLDLAKVKKHECTALEQTDHSLVIASRKSLLVVAKIAPGQDFSRNEVDLYMKNSLVLDAQLNTGLSLMLLRTINYLQVIDVLNNNVLFEFDLHNNDVRSHANSSLDTLVIQERGALVVHALTPCAQPFVAPVKSLNSKPIYNIVSSSDFKKVCFASEEEFIVVDLATDLRRSVPNDRTSFVCVEAIFNDCLYFVSQASSLICIKINDGSQVFDLDLRDVLVYMRSDRGDLLLCLSDAFEVRLFNTADANLLFRASLPVSSPYLRSKSLHIDIVDWTVCVFYEDTFYKMEAGDQAKQVVSQKMEDDSILNNYIDDLCLVFEGRCLLYTSAENSKIVLHRVSDSDLSIKTHLDIDGSVFTGSSLKSSVSPDQQHLVYILPSANLPGQCSVCTISLGLGFISNAMSARVIDRASTGCSLQFSEDNRYALIFDPAALCVVFSLSSRSVIFRNDFRMNSVAHLCLNFHDLRVLYKDGFLETVPTSQRHMGVFTDLVGMNMMRYNEYIDQKEKKSIGYNILNVLACVPVSNVLYDSVFSDAVVCLDDPEVLERFVERMGLQNALFYCNLIQAAIVNQKLKVIRGLLVLMERFKALNEGRIPRVNENEVLTMFNQNSSYYNSKESQDLIVSLMFNCYETIDVGLNDEHINFVNLNEVRSQFRCSREEKIQDAIVLLKDECPTTIHRMAVHVCEIPLLLDNGSEFSINFFPVLARMPDQYLKKYFSAIVFYKWKKVKGYSKMYAVLFSIMNIFSYLYLTVYLQNTFLFICILILSTAFVGFEVKCFLASPSNYFKLGNFKNTFDVSVLILNITCTVIMQSLGSTLTSEESTSRFVHILRFITLIAVCWRGAIVLYCFNSFRYLITMIMVVVVDISYFLVLILYMAFLYGGAWKIIPTILDGTFKEEQTSFWTSVLLGGGVALSGYEDNSENNTFQYIFAIVGGVFLGLVMQNFLISLIGDTYNQVKEDRIVNDTRVIIDLIFDWDCFLKGMGKTDTQYDMLYLLKADDDGETDKDEDRLVGLEKKMDKMIMMIQNQGKGNSSSGMPFIVERGRK